MKRLALLRHGKSSWSDPHLADFDRPLNKRGRQAAALIGAEMRRRRVGFDLAICSPARRAAETAKFLKEGLGSPVDPRFDERVYEARPEDLLQLLRRAEDEIDRLLVIGHNPGLQELATMLASSASAQRRRVAAHFPTAALAVLDIPAKRWSELAPGSGNIVDLLLPRHLAQS